MLGDTPKVLVIETGLIGELLVITPALRALRAAYPGASVTVMASPGPAAVLVGNPHVARIVAPSAKERAGPGGLLRLAAWIRAQRFDAAVVLHTSFRSALLAALGGVPVRAGLAWEARGFLLTTKAPRGRSAYEVDEHLRVLSLLGVRASGRELELHLTDQEREEARGLLGDVGTAGPIVCLHPGASREIRRWPWDRFAELGARLAAEGAASPVYLYGPREHELSERVAEGFSRLGVGRVLTLFPRNVRILGAVFAEASAVVTNNSGPMHVAAAVGVPGVFIHGPTPVRRWQPPGERYVALFAEDVDCRPCDTSACRQTKLLCMEGVPVEEVHRAVTDLMMAARAR